MPKQQSVPAFGGWNDGNISYTTVFNEARKDRNEGKRMENQFIPSNDTYRYESPIQSLGARNKAGQPRQRTRQLDEHVGWKENHMSPRVESPVPDAIMPRKHGGHGFGGDDAHMPRRKGSGGNGALHQHRALAGRVSQHEGVHGKFRSSDEKYSSKGASVPKFGGWNYNDNPSSGEGYTHIFAKVREQRHVGPAKISNTQPDSHCAYSPKDSTSRVSLACCFPWTKK